MLVGVRKIDYRGLFGIGTRERERGLVCIGKRERDRELVGISK